MKVVHITPTYFDETSLIGGGERYVTELASRMSKLVDTTLVSFSSKRKTYNQGNLKIEIYPVKHLIRGSIMNPLSFRYITEILRSDIVHLHHIYTLVSDLGCLAAYLLGKPVLVTEYGGGADFVLNQKLPVFRCYNHAVIYSKFGRRFLPTELQEKAELIKGGIDIDKFCLVPSLVPENKILYVGRILPHKGINYLIEGFRELKRPDYKLTILGRVYGDHGKRFYQDIKQLAAGLPVEFIQDADDCRLLHEYRTAVVTVLPSVHTTCYGDYTPIPELMGFTLLESQACGTPVICTDAGAMHEFVDNGLTGLVVKQNSGEAIAEGLCQFLDLSEKERMGYQERCRNWIQQFSWSTVVQKHLELYKDC
jgi:glycosyltransferase involved in cell wall biosynthesis